MLTGSQGRLSGSKQIDEEGVQRKELRRGLTGSPVAYTRFKQRRKVTVHPGVYIGRGRRGGYIGSKRRKVLEDVQGHAQNLSNGRG